MSVWVSRNLSRELGVEKRRRRRRRRSQFHQGLKPSQGTLLCHWGSSLLALLTSGSRPERPVFVEGGWVVKVPEEPIISSRFSFAFKK